jgi:hypothetical protein
MLPNESGGSNQRNGEFRGVSDAIRAGLAVPDGVVLSAGIRMPTVTGRNQHR